jgi:hypothetical protein
MISSSIARASILRIDTCFMLTDAGAVSRFARTRGYTTVMLPSPNKTDAQRMWGLFGDHSSLYFLGWCASVMVCVVTFLFFLKLLCHFGGAASELVAHDWVLYQYMTNDKGHPPVSSTAIFCEICFVIADFAHQQSHRDQRL